MTTLGKMPFEKTFVGIGENAGNLHFLLFQQCFRPYERQIKCFEKHFICRLQMLSILTRLKICRLVQGCTYLANLFFADTQFALSRETYNPRHVLQENNVS